MHLFFYRKLAAASREFFHMTAYFILVHRYPQQFKRLFKAIYEKKNCYLIHVDKRAGAQLLDEVTEFLSVYTNVYLLESQNVVWGGYSMVDVELNAIKKLLSLNASWDTYINLSGQDFPIKSMIEIEKFLQRNSTTNFLLVSDQKAERPNTLNRIQNFFTETATGFVGKPYRRTYLPNVTPYIGGQWKVLTRACCEFITQSRKVAKFRAYYKNTLIADEGFFQTVLKNTGFTGTVVNDDLRAIIWIPDTSQHTNLQTFSDNETKALVASGKIKLRPKTMTMKDKKFLIDSPALFGRKFDETIDSAILTALELHMNKPLKTKLTVSFAQNFAVPH